MFYNDNTFTIIVNCNFWWARTYRCWWSKPGLCASAAL